MSWRPPAWVILGLSSLLAVIPAPAAAQRGPVVVGSKPFSESFILAEMFAQILESRGIGVERRLGLGATEIAFQALRTGAIDVYPEYTGTGLVAILNQTPQGTAAQVYREVSRAFRERWSVTGWIVPGR